MDIQEELIDCNNWILDQDDDFVTGYGQGNYALGLARLAWQAAKAQAVQEGFVLVNAESLALHAKSIRMFNNSEEEEDYYEIENHVCAIEAMIEAQEKNND